MLLFFRFLRVLLTARLKPRIDPLGEAVLRFRVMPNDCDLNVHMNSGRYVSFNDIGRVDLLLRMRLFRKVIKRGWRPIAGGSMIRYRRSLMPFESFRLRSRVVAWDEKWFYFEHIIERANGELAALSHVRGLLRGPEGNVAPRELLELAGKDETSPPIPDFVRKWNEAEELR
jgi:acyl-CoA thioesterase FadM